MNEQISHSKYVALTYTITDQNDEILEVMNQPIDFIFGEDDNLVEKIEKGLEGHRAGDEITIELTADEGFGPRLEELTFTDDLENVPHEFHEVGAEIEFQNDRDEFKTFRVTKIENGKLTFDGNHPFAGKDIRFNITIQEVREPTPEELTNGIQATHQVH